MCDSRGLLHDSMAPPPRGAVGAAVGGDDALRAHQNSQLCKQMAALATQLANEVGRSELLLESVYALGDFATSPACCLEQIAATYPEVCLRRGYVYVAGVYRHMHSRACMLAATARGSICTSIHRSAGCRPFSRPLPSLPPSCSVP